MAELIRVDGLTSSAITAALRSFTGPSVRLFAGPESGAPLPPPAEPTPDSIRVWHRPLPVSWRLPDAWKTLLLRPGSILAIDCPRSVAQTLPEFRDGTADSLVDWVWRARLAGLDLRLCPVPGEGMSLPDLVCPPLSRGAVLSCQALAELPQTPLGQTVRDPTRRTALAAGLLLWQDAFDLSHQQSQSIEHCGAPVLGDHWHALAHRREPDYGNARYWYRAAGTCVSWPPLGAAAHDWLRTSGLAPASLSGIRPSTTEIDRRVCPDGEWQPLGFLQLVEELAPRPAADPARTVAVELQGLEMLALLAACLDA